MSVRPSPLSLSAFSGPSPLLPQSLFSVYFSLYLSPSISLFSSFCLSLPFSFVVSVWRTLSLSVNLFTGFPVFLSLNLLFFYIHVQLVSASLSLYLATSSPSMPRTCISALPEPASQSVSRPPLHASVYWLTCLSLLCFLSFSLPVISLCTFSLDIVRLAASLSPRPFWDTGFRLSLAHALCMSLEFCSSLFLSLISSFGNQAFSKWLVIRPSQILSPSPKRQKTIMLSSN